MQLSYSMMCWAWVLLKLGRNVYYSQTNNESVNLLTEICLNVYSTDQ